VALACRRRRRRGSRIPLGSQIQVVLHEESHDLSREGPDLLQLGVGQAAGIAGASKKATRFSKPACEGANPLSPSSLVAGETPGDLGRTMSRPASRSSCLRPPSLTVRGGLSCQARSALRGRGDFRRAALVRFHNMVELAVQVPPHADLGDAGAATGSPGGVADCQISWQGYGNRRTTASQSHVGKLSAGGLAQD
jgi:hypothetical protein